MNEQLQRHLDTVRQRHNDMTDIELQELATERLAQATDASLSSEKRTRLASEGTLFGEMLIDRAPPEPTVDDHLQRLRETNPEAARNLEFGMKMELGISTANDIQQKIDDLGDGTDPITVSKRERLQESLNKALEANTAAEAGSPSMQRDAKVADLKEQADSKRLEAARALHVDDPAVADALESEAIDLGREASRIRSGGAYE
ncbi:MAG: hypothetical protein ABJN62_09735 [Halioglobus sp.]